MCSLTFKISGGILRVIQSKLCYLLIIFSLLAHDIEGSALPTTVSCTRSHVKQQIFEWYRLKCGGENAILTSLDELHPKWFQNSSEITSLDLSENNLTQVSAHLPNLPSILKLDLSKNRISKIEAGAFSNFTTLKTLDLSNNKLKHISRGIFEGLANLERLKLSDNQISQIKEGTFDDLTSLKKIDLSTNPLTCDCSLWWLPGWARNQSVKFAPLPKCNSPPALHGQPVRKFKPGIHYPYCDWPTPQSGSLLELRPDQNQVVFEGDSLRLQCRATKIALEPSVDGGVIFWKWAGLNPAEVFDGTIDVKNRSLKDSGLIESTLEVEHLTSNHSGQWDCYLMSSIVNQSTSIGIVVITDSTDYCPMIVTASNRGRYVWPKTVAGNTVELPCTSQGEGDDDGMAKQACNETGRWVNLDTSTCPFISEVTRTLYQFSQMNASAITGSALESIHRFCNYTVNPGRPLTDEMDIIFITTTIENYIGFVKTETEVGKVLLDIVRGMMRQPRGLLLNSQRLEHAASRLVAVVEKVVQLSPSFQLHNIPHRNLVMEEFRVSWGRNFQGISCSWYGYHSGDERLFNCSTVNNTGLRGTKDMVMEASIQVPASLFYQLEMQGYPGASHQLMVSMYDNSKLFPRVDANDTMDVTTCVVGAKLLGLEVAHLAEPVFLMLRMSGGQGFPKPVWWDSANSEWRSDGCRVSNLSHLLNDVLIFQCYRLGYFAVLQDVSHLDIHEVLPAKSRLAPPAVYVGTFIGATCMLVAALSYAFYRTCIQMPTKAKHSLANTWVAIALLFITYSVGIHQTEERGTCRMIGLFIHYFTLCSLFWMALSINGLYKRVSKREVVRIGASAESEGEEVVVGQPLVGVYLVGWGISLLLCGLSGAVNLPGYAALTHCSLGPGPGVSAILVPSSCLIFYLLIRTLMVECASLNLDSNVQLSEGTQATDLELLDNNTATAVVSDGQQRDGSMHSIATPSSQIEDSEHSPSTQLKAFLIVLFLFITTWISAALTALTPFNFPYEETVFSVIYSILIIILGTFIVFFYCFARNDIRSGWFTLKPCCRSRNVTDSRTAPPPLVSSSDSLDSSSGRKSAAAGLNSTLPLHSAHDMKNPANVSLMVMHRRQYHPNNGVIGGSEADIFYNPHQIGVARKFFKKQRRKQNNLMGGRRNGDGGSSPVPLGLLGGSSKVNNTNLHIELIPEKSSDPNLLSGDATLPLDRLIIGGERRPLNNDGSIRSTEDQLTSQLSSCGAISGPDTDCGRDISNQQSCGSSHIAVSDQSDGSHLYATIDPPSPILQQQSKSRKGRRPLPEIKPRNNLSYGKPLSRSRRSHSDSEHRSTDDSNGDKKETCV